MSSESLLDRVALLLEKKRALDRLVTKLKDREGDDARSWTTFHLAANDALGMVDSPVRAAYAMLDRLEQLAEEALAAMPEQRST